MTGFSLVMFGFYLQTKVLTLYFEHCLNHMIKFNLFESSSTKIVSNGRTSDMCRIAVGKFHIQKYDSFGFVDAFGETIGIDLGNSFS